MQLVPGPSRSKPITAPSLPARVLPARALPAAASPLRLVSPAASAWSVSRGKRFFDMAFSLAVLVVCALPMLFIALGIRITSPGPALFAQKRMGRRGKLFSVYKFRSMDWHSPVSAIGLTRKGDCRVTPLGRWLRRLKLDELPQFLNVLRGQMSVVGPRPKLPRYHAIVNMPYRPGITGAATLAFRREEEILGRVHPAQVEDFYLRHIKPIKARIDARYMSRATLWSDLRIVAATVLACVAPPRESSLPRAHSAPSSALEALPMAESAAGEPMGQSN